MKKVILIHLAISKLKVKKYQLKLRQLDKNGEKKYGLNLVLIKMAALMKILMIGQEKLHYRKSN